jgi:hypothetical protein
MTTEKLPIKVMLNRRNAMWILDIDPKEIGMLYYCDDCRPAVLSHAHEVDIDTLLKQWISLEANWQEEEYGDSGKIDIFTGQAAPFSEFLQSKLVVHRRRNDRETKTE